MIRIIRVISQIDTAPPHPIVFITAGVMWYVSIVYQFAKLFELFDPLKPTY